MKLSRPPGLWDLNVSYWLTLGMALLIWMLVGISNHMEDRRPWVEVPGELLGLSTHWHPKSDHAVAMLIYRYTFGNQAFTGVYRVDVKGDALIRDEAEVLHLLGLPAAQLKQLPYPRGPIVVQVDPAKPDRSRLDLPEREDFSWIGWLIVLCLLDVWWLWWLYQRWQAQLWSIRRQKKHLGRP